MATTTNFSWDTPDDTDLVKDGAAAIRTLGSAIDSSFVDLKGGTTGQVLSKASGTDLDFTWSAVGGKVLQVVTGSYSTLASSSSSTYADTGLTASITPSSASSKILVMVTQAGCGKDNVSSNAAENLRLLRGATAIQTFAIFVAYTGTAIANYLGTVSTLYLDSPATTSSTTYKTQFASANNNNTVFTQVGGDTSTIVLLEIGA